jgi:hypothetical protein
MKDHCIWLNDRVLLRDNLLFFFKLSQKFVDAGLKIKESKLKAIPHTVIDLSELVNEAYQILYIKLALKEVARAIASKTQLLKILPAVLV